MGFGWIIDQQLVIFNFEGWWPHSTHGGREHWAHQYRESRLLIHDLYFISVRCCFNDEIHLLPVLTWVFCVLGEFTMLELAETVKEVSFFPFPNSLLLPLSGINIDPLEERALLSSSIFAPAYLSLFCFTVVSVYVTGFLCANITLETKNINLDGEKLVLITMETEMLYYVTCSLSILKWRSQWWRTHQTILAKESQISPRQRSF